jgi:hypothetical protein
VSPELCRRWIHVREEDGDGVRVFRPAGRPLPPARGRDGLEFRPDGTFVELRPGPVDAPVAGPPRPWSVGGSRLDLAEAAHEIVELSDDVLRLRPL